MITLPTLYSLATNGKIKTLTVEIHTDSYRTITGYLDGIKTTSAFKTCKAKSYCTANEQASKEAHAFYSKKIAMDWFDSIDDIQIKTFFSPMLAKDWEDEKNKVKYPLYSQPKLDGVRAIITSEGVFSRTGKINISVPHIFNSLKHLFDANPTLILDGELFAEKDICDFNKIISCVKKTKPTVEDLQESANYIKFYIYDIPSVNSVFVERNTVLQSLTYSKYCVIVPTVKVDTVEQSDILYCQYMADGYEGQMLRVNDMYENKRSKHLIKRKEFTTEEFIIADVLEGKGKLANKVGKLDFGTFDSAVNGTHDYLKMLWDTKDTLIGVTATVKYFELTEDGIPRFPKVIAINREAYE